MASNKRLNELNEFLSIAKHLGADEAEIFSSSGESIFLSSQGKDIKTKEFSFDAGYSVRVLKQGKIGFAPFRKKEDAGRAVSTALALSKFSPCAEFSFAPRQKYEKAKTFDKKLAEFDEKDALSLLSSILSGSSKYGSKPLECYLSVSRGKALIANSNGLFAEQDETSLFAAASSGFKNSSGFESFSCRRLGKKELSSAGAIGEKSAKLAKQMSGAKKLASQQATVAFEKDSLSSLLSVLMTSFSGERARRKLSLLCGKQGTEIADSRFSLTDNALADAFSLSSFDGEGVSSRQIPLIEKGVFRNFLFDRWNAALARSNADGACDRSGYLSRPSISCSNIVVSFSGKAPEPGKYLIIQSILGEHTANPTTGDFSFSVEGFSVSGSKSTPFRGNLLVANIFKLLNGIEAAGKRSETYSSIISPRLYFSKVQVVGE